MRAREPPWCTTDPRAVSTQGHPHAALSTDGPGLLRPAILIVVAAFAALVAIAGCSLGVVAAGPSGSPVAPPPSVTPAVALPTPVPSGRPACRRPACRSRVRRQPARPDDPGGDGVDGLVIPLECSCPTTCSSPVSDPKA